LWNFFSPGCEALGLLHIRLVGRNERVRDKRRTTMEYREPCPPTTDIQHLEQVGFSHEQIAGLLRVKALSERGAYHKAESSDKRQAFIRWLYLQGRLQS
jgi:hypothetical protein